VTTWCATSITSALPMLSVSALEPISVQYYIVEQVMIRRSYAFLFKKGDKIG
jgi:hypothetical protein